MGRGRTAAALLWQSTTRVRAVGLSVALPGADGEGGRRVLRALGKEGLGPPVLMAEGSGIL